MTYPKLNSAPGTDQNRSCKRFQKMEGLWSRGGAWRGCSQQVGSDKVGVKEVLQVEALA